MFLLSESVLPGQLANHWGQVTGSHSLEGQLSLPTKFGLHICLQSSEDIQVALVYDVTAAGSAQKSTQSHPHAVWASRAPAALTPLPCNWLCASVSTCLKWGCKGIYLIHFCDCWGFISIKRRARYLACMSYCGSTSDHKPNEWTQGEHSIRFAVEGAQVIWLSWDERQASRHLVPFSAPQAHLMIAKFKHTIARKHLSKASSAFA